MSVTELPEKMASSLTEIKEQHAEYLAGEGDVEFFKQDGKFFLGQGEVAVDITKILHMVNNPMGRISLNIRLNNHRNVHAGNKAWNWMIESLRNVTKKDDENGYSYPEDGEE